MRAQQVLLKKIGVILTGLLVLAGGIAGSLLQAHGESQRARRNILMIVNGLGTVIDGRDVSALTGTPEDQHRTAYRKLNQLFSRARQSIPDCSDVYLMYEKDDVYSFGCGSHFEGEEDYLLPGLRYDEVDDITRNFFESGRKLLVYGPEKDRWGSWVSGYVRLPMLTHAGHNVVLGMDIAANRWYGTLISHSLLPLLSALVIDVLLFLLWYFVGRLRRAYAVLRAAKEDAETANIAKTQFLSVVSDGLRTPLMPIVSYATLLLDGIDRNTSAHDMVKDMLRSSKELVAVIDQILLLGAMDMDKLIPEPEGVQLQELERVTNLQAQWIIGDKKLIYECNVKGDAEKKFLLDMEMLKRIMHHLLSNAVKFTPAGGNIEVQIDLQTDPDSEVCRLVISVEDTGCGVEAGKEELIFEPFRQADLSNTRAHGGVGLGLAIVRNMLERLNGQVRHVPGRNGGACFRMEIPVGCGATTESIMKEVGAV